MLKLKVNNIEFEVEEGFTVLQACEKAGVEIPRFCYHEKLSIAGNCRMCLVEIEKSPKPVASCAMPAAEGMNIKTNTEFVEKARKGVMEFLLANHPLDCPVCDQGGECDLQDQSMFYGVDKSRYNENKRQVPEKNMGPLIKTQMTRCIHCTRCIRFATEVAGVPELGAIGRGEDMQITTYLEESMQSELSANVVDLCPVGALTSKPYVFEARPWELKKTETIDVMDAVGSNIRVDTYGWEVKRVLPRINEDINEEWISDKTRYACDGLLNQRLDTPYIKYNGKFEKATWKEAFNIIKSKFKNADKEKICGITGDMVNMETLYIFKEFFNKTLGSYNIESRNDHTYLNPNKRENYLFNSSINGIEEADFILLVGSNPRYEATILNSRIRKSYIQNKTIIKSLNDVGNLTYPYEALNGDIDNIKNIAENNHEISKLIKEAKKPLIIIGQSALNAKSAKFIFESLKSFLNKNNKISNEWNSLNVISKNASTVGSFDLGLYKTNDGSNEVLKDLENNKFEIVYLLGQDNLKFKKQNEFIIYQGSHGDKGAEIADIILPGAAYTEQNGYYTNLEGKLQKAYKASFPPEEAKEDWQIINELAEIMNHRKLFNDKDELDSSLLNQINLHIEKDNSKKNLEEINDLKLEKEILKIDIDDYYYSNAIARASKTMFECKNAKTNLKSTGTEG
jgi:NADH-quinone oxidoreductase subunit G